MALSFAWAIGAAAQGPVEWRFDNVRKIGGVATTAVGSPMVVPTNIGNAVHFEGHGATGDALFVDTVPLVGALNYTFEVVFRPAANGSAEQRFFHMQESTSQSRRMFEIRIHGDKWCLDTVAFNFPAGEKARSGVMLNCDEQHLFPVDKWYAVAAVYNGKTLRAYVDGVLQGEIDVALLPLGQGSTSVGTRIDKRDFFTGDVYSARFTPKALPLGELLKVPMQR